jgi:hypothetical protein
MLFVCFWCGYNVNVCVFQHAQCGLDLRHVTVIELVGIYPAQIGRISHRLIPPGLALQLRYTHTHTHTVIIIHYKPITHSSDLPLCVQP